MEQSLPLKKPSDSQTNLSGSAVVDTTVLDEPDRGSMVEVETEMYELVVDGDELDDEDWVVDADVDDAAVVGDDDVEDGVLVDDGCCVVVVTVA